MAYPSQADVEEALEAELRRRGVPTKPLDLYDSLADVFGLSKADRERLRTDGQPGRVWWNKVQWARRGLVDRGVIVHRPYRPWALAEWDR